VPELTVVSSNDKKKMLTINDSSKYPIITGIRISQPLQNNDEPLRRNLWSEKCHSFISYIREFPNFTFQVTLHITLSKGDSWNKPVAEQPKDIAVTTKVDIILSYFN
jgi:hypothetical protein